MPRQLGDLSAREFENLTYDLLRLSGFENLTWRTPGSDEGRDIEGVIFVTDASGERSAQRWYIECKRYNSSIGWPVLWEKLSYANVKCVEYFLLSTNNNPSPQCETQIYEWNQNSRSPKIRIWRGYQLEHLIRLHGVLALKYGLRDPASDFFHDFGPLAQLLTKTIQASYVAYGLDLDGTRALEAASALSELLTLRMEQVAKYGSFSIPIEDQQDALFHWLSIGGNRSILSCFDSVGMRALCAYLRFAAGWDRVTLELNSQCGMIRSDSGVAEGGGVSKAVWRALGWMEPWLLFYISLSADAHEVHVIPGEGPAHG